MNRQLKSISFLIICLFFFGSFFGCTTRNSSEGGTDSDLKKRILDQSGRRELPTQYFSYEHPAQQIIKIDPVALGVCLAKAAQLLGTSTKQAVDWDHKKTEAPNLFEYLIGGKGIYQTGKENILEEWLLAQTPNSVTPVSLFEQSLKIHNLSVFNAILAAHQLFRVRSRWWETYVTVHNKKSILQPFEKEAKQFERQKELFGKLQDIRGDLVERGAGFFGDHPGSWYRFWGIALYAMRLAPLDGGLKPHLHPGYLKIKIQGEGISKIAEFSKLLTGWPEPDKRKHEVNSAGVETVFYMLQSAAGDPLLKAKNPDCQNPEVYLIKTN